MKSSKEGPVFSLRWDFLPANIGKPIPASLLKQKGFIRVSVESGYLSCTTAD
jgi:hypothetical protein